MRLYYESYLQPKVIEELNISFVNKKVLELEDIVFSKDDIELQELKQIEQNFTFKLANIQIINTVKNKKTYGKFNDAQTLKSLEYDYGVTYYIKLEVVNVNSEGFDINIYLNNNLIETITFRDYYLYQNNKNITLYSEILNANIYISNPKYIYNFENSIYSLKFISNFEYDKFRNNIIVFDESISNVSYILKSYGNILRARTINKLITHEESLDLYIPESDTRIQLLNPIVVPNGKNIYFIMPHDLLFNIAEIPAGYSFIGIYIDLDALKLNYKIIDSDGNYSSLIEKIQHTLMKDSYMQIVFGIVENAISYLKQHDIYYLNLGSGGSGGSDLNKITVDFENTDELNITYTGGMTPPILEIFDNNGDKIVPQNIHYNYSNQITITFGEIVSGKVVII